MGKSVFVALLSLLGTALASYNNPTCQPGRTVIVHLFNWKWTDIAKECERFLGPKGFCGVQVSPPNEHAMIMESVKKRPWWERYQPISYKLESRSGNRQEFIDMVERCNNVGVGIFPDMVINHMCGAGIPAGKGSGGSDFNPGTLDFSGVPYSRLDFNGCDGCDGYCNIADYRNVHQVRNCRLVGLLDIALSKDYARGKVAGFFNDLIDIGVAGFRVDAAKHMWPGDMQAIYNRLHNLNTRWFPGGSKPFMFNEVIDLGGEAIQATEYTHLGRVTEFRFSADIGRRFRRWEALKWLKDMGEKWGWLPSNNALTFVDNHDNQRGHGAGGSSIVTHTFPRAYKMATAFTLAHPYGFVRIMSSYEWNNIDWLGPPTHEDWTIKDVEIKPDGTCGDRWKCEHRWRQITNMVWFRNVVDGTPMQNWWDNGAHQIAFSRGNKGFLAINNEEYNDMTVTLQTGMPAGSYCDVISGNLEGGSCTGKTINVGSDGRASISISARDEDPMVAFHAESRVGSGGGVKPTLPPQPGTTRLVATPPPNPGTGPAGGFDTPTCRLGRTVIVHLFNWKWTDIAQECERFLGPEGFCGVQVSPPNEHRIVMNGEKQRPWWERYQPISYKLESRSGNRQQFIDMVERCNNVGVGIYPDMVVNHMCGVDAGRGKGTGGSDYDTESQDFPGVPFSRNDFNGCEGCSSNCNIADYSNVNQVRNCRLVGLLDIALSKDYARSKVAGYFNDLIDIGVAGFRVDAAKHMWPGDMEAVYNSLHSLNTRWFAAGSKPFMFNEVIDLGGEPIKTTEYSHLGRVTEFRFSADIGRRFRRQDALKWLKDMGEKWGWLPGSKALTFVDNHDNQRGHGAGGSSIITHTSPRAYKMATAFKLAHPYGFVRIMSSYEWKNIDWLGPPTNGDWTIKDVEIKPDGTCGDRWVCEHRWRQIANMVRFRNVVDSTSLENWWDNGAHQIAFSRGNKGFLAINNEEYNDMTATLQTGMPAGSYCDVISGKLESGSCTGKTINVGSDGRASISISARDEDPMVAFHAESRVGSGGGVQPTNPPQPGTTRPVVTQTSGPIVTQPPQPTLPPPTGMSRTIIFLAKRTNPGQDLFLRGGIGHTVRAGCTQTAATSACAIPIQHRDVGTGSHYSRYNAWRDGDNYLDWYGAEPSQGRYNNWQAWGSPSVWTTNVPGAPGYQPINTFGEHYWMFEADMDCSKSENGWFEFKGYLTNYATNSGWEYDRTQDRTCGGTAGGVTPYSSKNHMARCGFVNVFSWDSNSCTIDNF